MTPRPRGRVFERKGNRLLDAVGRGERREERKGKREERNVLKHVRIQDLRLASRFDLDWSHISLFTSSFLPSRLILHAGFRQKIPRRSAVNKPLRGPVGLPGSRDRSRSRSWRAVNPGQKPAIGVGRRQSCCRKATNLPFGGLFGDTWCRLAAIESREAASHRRWHRRLSEAMA